MFRFHRIARAKPNKFPDAVRWAKEVAEHINTKYAPISVQAYAELFGDVNTIHWYADYEDLATIERANAQLLADQGYWTLLNKAGDLFIEGSSHDTLIQSL